MKLPLVFQIFCVPTCCYRFHGNFSSRSMIPKMIFHLGFVDLVDHVASSISARHVVLSELSQFFGTAHPRFSYIPLSQCKQQECCGERLHVTVFGKIASLSLDRAPNCINIHFLRAFPSILVWRDPWFRQIAWSFSHTIYVFRRVHCGEGYRLSSSLVAFSSSN